MMTIAEFAKNPERMKAYLEWRDLPMTKEILSMARTAFLPLGLPVAERTGEKALYYAGQVDATTLVLHFASSLAEFVQDQEVLAKTASLVPSYGADAILAAQEQHRET